MYWRAQRCHQWRIAAFEMIYLLDTIAPADPTRPIPPEVLAGADVHRPSYRWISLLLASKNHEIDGELPGIDRPDLVGAFLEGRQQWLLDGGDPGDGLG